MVDDIMCAIIRHVKHVSHEKQICIVKCKSEGDFEKKKEVNGLLMMFSHAHEQKSGNENLADISSQSDQSK